MSPFPRSMQLRLFLWLAFALATIIPALAQSEEPNSPAAPAAVVESAAAPAAATVSETSAPESASTNAAGSAVQAAAPATNSISSAALPPAPPLPNVTGSFIRVMSMLALVLALFLGGVWVVRNWQRLAMPRGQTPKLNILETRSLGGRHAILVVGYENERFLVASSPAGINLLTHLQSADAGAAEPAQAPAAATAPAPAFAATLANMLKRRSP